MKQLPNILTGFRLLMAPAVAWLLWKYWEPLILEQPAADRAGWIYAAAILFVVAAMTDLVDGLAARLLNAESRLGRILDPIADKALVGLPLVVLSIAAWRLDAMIWPVVAICTAVIVVRDAGITAYRFMSPDGEGVRVSPLAKWKTAVELVAVAAPLLLLSAGEWLTADLAAGDLAGPVMIVMGWLAVLVLAAGLSALTGAQYLRKTPGAPKA